MTHPAVGFELLAGGGLFQYRFALGCEGVIAMETVHCPFCLQPLTLQGPDEASCSTGHVFDAASLTLAGNMAAARALWMAMRAMEDDAAGLNWRAGQAYTPPEVSIELRAEEQTAREAAAALRLLAKAAQQRLDALPLPLSVVRLEERPPVP